MLSRVKEMMDIERPACHCSTSNSYGGDYSNSRVPPWPWTHIVHPPHPQPRCGTAAGPGPWGPEAVLDPALADASCFFSFSDRLSFSLTPVPRGGFIPVRLGDTLCDSLPRHSKSSGPVTFRAFREPPGKSDSEARGMHVGFPLVEKKKLSSLPQLREQPTIRQEVNECRASKGHN